MKRTLTFISFAYVTSLFVLPRKVSKYNKKLRNKDQQNGLEAKDKIEKSEKEGKLCGAKSG